MFNHFASFKSVPIAIKNGAGWGHSGYREIQAPPKRYGVIDLREPSALCGFGEEADFQQARRQWVGKALAREMAVREDRWSEAIAVGSFLV